MITGINAFSSIFQADADTAIHLVAPNKYLVLTDEVALAQTLNARGVDVVNFNHIRMLA